MVIKKFSKHSGGGLCYTRMDIKDKVEIKLIKENNIKIVNEFFKENPELNAERFKHRFATDFSESFPLSFFGTYLPVAIKNLKLCARTPHAEIPTFPTIF